MLNLIEKIINYKFNPFHFKHLIFLIDEQLSLNPVWNQTLYIAVGMIGRLQFETLPNAQFIFVDCLAWYSKSIVILMLWNSRGISVHAFEFS